MTKRSLPTPEELRQLLRYEPETGKLFWKERSAEMFKDKRTHGMWNTRYAGKEAFTTISAYGYRGGKVFDRMYLTHRVAWAIHYGEWPDDQIDHVDNDKLNNRIGNLREATHSENMHNQGVRKTNTSGYKGVSWDSGRKTYRARIRLGGKMIYLGRFSSAEAAHAAYCEAAKKYHGDFARTA